MNKKTLSSHNKSLIPFRAVFGYSALAIISGLSGFLFIVLVNKVIDQSLSSGLPREGTYVWMFLGTAFVFFITRRWLSGGIIQLSQKIYWDIRKDVIWLVLRAPYLKLKKYKDEVYTTLTADVGNITNASLLIINFFSSIILIIACLVYMAYLSLSMFFISFGVIAIAILIYLARSSKGNAQFKKSRELEDSFMNIFNSILDGAKEININPDKGKDIYHGKMLDVVNQGERINVKAFLRFLNTEIISQLSFYILITFILIYSSSLLGVGFSVAISFVFVLLYLLGPIVSVMSIIPFMSRAVVSLNKMDRLRTELQQVQEDKEMRTANNEKYCSFTTLEIKDYAFSFGQNKFSVGPLNLKINRNEVLFIYGGNGAGKTTFINTLLQLYQLERGEVYLDGCKIPDKDFDQIKQLFSVVFSDFYLFDEFYGINHVDVDKARYYLELFELDAKVSIENNKFSMIDLSTGQRKRLALISALLENRPILVLDEWAADQDAFFRSKFYSTIIPIITRDEDRTLIAITHDDKYYSYADNLFKMEYGEFVEVNSLYPDPSPMPTYPR